MGHIVDFFVIGVQKGGTTALAHYLRQHPAIQMSRVKEVHHFDNEGINWSAPNHVGLHTQFDWGVEGVMRGEATPIYIYWPSSLRRLQRYNPKARLLVGLRHPVSRAYSHWRMEKKRDIETLSFEEAIADAGRVRVRESPGRVHRVYSYVEHGFYAEQIERLLRLFPKEQVFFFCTDELWNDTGTILAGIEKFLGVESRTASVVRRYYIVPVNSTDLGNIPGRTRPMLNAI